MRTVILTGRFRKDSKLLQKQGKDLQKLATVIEMLRQGTTLPQHYRDHKLVGNYRGRRECHIEPDWLLIYQLSGETVVLERTGSHSELFD